MIIGRYALIMTADRKHTRTPHVHALAGVRKTISQTRHCCHPWLPSPNRNGHTVITVRKESYYIELLFYRTYSALLRSVDDRLEKKTTNLYTRDKYIWHVRITAESAFTIPQLYYLPMTNNNCICIYVPYLRSTINLIVYSIHLVGSTVCVYPRT